MILKIDSRIEIMNLHAKTFFKTPFFVTLARRLSNFFFKTLAMISSLSYGFKCRRPYSF